MQSYMHPVPKGATSEPGLSANSLLALVCSRSRRLCMMLHRSGTIQINLLAHVQWTING